MDEPDIGSGEKSPGQREIERDQQALNTPQQDSESVSSDDDVLRSAGHLARFTARRLDDGMYEAQVYVRLAREPEVAETYIPAGSFATEEQALAAARQRAARALREQEF